MEKRPATPKVKPLTAQEANDLISLHKEQGFKNNHALLQLLRAAGCNVISAGLASAIERSNFDNGDSLLRGK